MKRPRQIQLTPSTRRIGRHSTRKSATGKQGSPPHVSRRQRQGPRSGFPLELMGSVFKGGD